MVSTNWQQIREQAHGDVLSYMALVKPESKFGPHHELFRDVISELYTGSKRFICLSCPPRHSKSYTFSQALPAWWLGNKPKDQVIATSYGAALAQSFGSSVRADMSSDLYGKIFSNLSQPSGSSQSGTDFSTNSGGKYKATGVGGSLTGFGADLIIVDDPVKNAETADSPRYKDMLEKFFAETLYTRLMPNGKIVVMATRWREDDLIGYILKNFSDWEYINVPAISEQQDLLPSGLDKLGRSEGEALWPDFFKTEDLLRTKSVLGERSFNALYQGRPVAAGGGKISATDLRQLEPSDIQFCPELGDYSFWSWDTALTTKQSSDFTVGQHWLVRVDFASGKIAKLILLDYVRFRGDFTQITDSIAECYDRVQFAADFVLIEHSHSGLNLKAQLDKDRPDISVELFQPRQYGDKMARLQASLPSFKTGLVWLDRATLSKHEDWNDCLDELLKALMTAHDDFLDSATQAVLFATDANRSKATSTLPRFVRSTGSDKLPQFTALGRSKAKSLAKSWL